MEASEEVLEVLLEIDELWKEISLTPSRDNVVTSVE